MDMQQQKLTALFNKYVGKEVRNPARVTTDIDPVMEDLIMEAAEAGYMSQVRMPGKMYDCAMLRNRLQIHVDEGRNGKFMITRLQVG